MKRSIVSLYSGGGGLDIGFHQEGFYSALCVESHPVMCETLERNHVSEKIICDEIQNVSDGVFKEARVNCEGRPDLVLGGPPCPAFSKSRFYRKEMTHGTDDVSFQTIIHYFRVVALTKPRVFVLENVHTFAAKRQKGALEYVLNEGEKLGYNTTYKILNAADYGVPQKRMRIFIVGVADGLDFSFPEPTNKNPENEDLLNSNLPNWLTAGDAISDLDIPENNAALPMHFAGGKHHDLLKEIPPGDNYLYFTQERGHPSPKFKWRSRYWSFLLKLSPDLPSWTIQARRSNNMGPFHWNNRILTIDEVKRLQTFPDDYQLSGSIENQWRQVGNAVPPTLARKIASSVRQLLC